jgi:hypothetical protein
MGSVFMVDEWWMNGLWMNIMNQVWMDGWMLDEIKMDNG